MEARASLISAAAETIVYTARVIWWIPQALEA